MSNELNKAILTALTQHTSYLQREIQKEVNQAIGSLSSIVETKVEKIATILRNMNESEKSTFLAGNYNTERLKKLKTLLVEIRDEIYDSTYPSFEEFAVKSMEYESAYVAKLAGDEAAAVAGAKLYESASKIPNAQGLLLSEAFRDLAEKTALNIRKTLRVGLRDGWTNDQILKQVLGQEDLPDSPSDMRTAKIALMSAIRTSRMQVANTSYIETYKSLGYTHVRVVATIDGRTCTVCADLDGNIYPIDGKYPMFPQHPNSRTVLVGCDEKGELIGRRPYVLSDKAVKNIPKDERDGVIGQVNAKAKFKDVFDTIATEDFKRNWLGATRYKLYKEGKYEISDFVDPITNKEYTIAQLRELDEKTFKELGL